VLHRLAFISLVALGAMTALGGCAQEDYYCDTDGCYFCDGVGCRDVDPPMRDDCRGDFECSGGLICTDIGCTSFGCSSDDACEMGTVCRDGWCVAPTEPTPNPTSGECTTSAECDADLECLDGVCTPSVAPAGCTEDAECATGEICLDGECRAEEDTCHFNTECGPGRVCIDERCTTGCGLDNPCPEGQMCGADGFCLNTPPPTGECVENSDCDAGQICLDGACIDECTGTDDTECGEGRYCAAGGRCRPDDRPSPFCVTDDDCMEGAVCRNGACRSPCAEHAECPRFDVSLNFCLDMVCATTNEATSDCDEASDCNPGQSCVDGICS